MTLAEWANTAVSGLVALCAMVFVVTYHRLAPWRGSGVGWYLMSFVVTIGMLGAYTVVIMAVGVDGPAATVLRLVRTVLLLTVAGLLLQGTRAMWRAQRHG
jgi:hypothetical protein